MERAHRRRYARERDLVTVRRWRRPCAGRRRSEPEKNDGPCSRRGALPVPVQVRLSHKDGELEPLYVMWASSLLRSVHEWRGARDHCKALSCLQWRAGGAVQRSRCYALDNAPGWSKICLPIRFNENASVSSPRSAWLDRFSPRTEKGTATRTQGLNMRLLPVL